MSEEFTGERLHAGDPLFAVDLARHEAAYEVARAHAGAGWALDFGCGSGYGTASLARGGTRVAGLDRARPDGESRGEGGAFVRADVGAAPFASGAFELVVSFQVIEHFSDPADYLAELARVLRPDGVALLTTPNRLTSDGVNPFHVREYEADELAALLRQRFAEVELRGIGTSERVGRHLAARSQRIRRIVRLDPLRLRERLPPPLLEWLFARFARLVRRGGEETPDLADVSWRDYPVGPADPGCLDLLAVCRRPLP